ncbi:hypothetical protein MPH_00312 [Macrophomina phaseolina MS6]|uniref:Uncharacterized protein n=1 Tax=Macrophomina phaseolina (strain MS6) TaxID=1126212 RepID=K2SBM6_MACPH|nr:hypothetical protein MPH_00312 [Macrophomina phaseolina MS6]
MKLHISLLPLLASGALALPRPQELSNQPPQGQLPQQPPQSLPQQGNQLSNVPPNQGAPTSQFQQQPGTQEQQLFASEVGPGFSFLLAVETSPKGEKAIVAWAFGRSQCVERQLVSKGLNFCGKWLLFNRVPELDPNLQATGDWEQVWITFVGCDERSRTGDYSGIYMAIYTPSEFEGGFLDQSPNNQGQLGGGQLGGGQLGQGGQGQIQPPNPNQQQQQQQQQQNNIPPGTTGQQNTVPQQGNNGQFNQLNQAPNSQFQNNNPLPNDQNNRPTIANSGQLPYNPPDQVRQVQPTKPDKNKPIPLTTVNQLPNNLPGDSKALQNAGQPQQQQQQSQPVGGNDIDPATQEEAGLGWSTGSSGSSGSSGVSGGWGSGGYPWVASYVQFYLCNGDRELHGCRYNSEEDTDLTTFLSVSLAPFSCF